MKLFVPVCSKRLFVVTALLLACFYNTATAQTNECTGIVTPLTVYSGTCGVATNGTTIGATQSLPACATGTTADDDVWFSFVQNGGAITVTVTGGGGAGQLKNPVFEVFSGTCGGTLTSVFCDNNATNNTEGGTLPNNLINGDTYYVRVYSAGNAAGDRGTFTICLTRPTPPANDNAAGATALTPAAISATAGCPGGAAQVTGQTLVNATNSAVTGACGGSADDDVWYRFTATNASTVVTVSNLGNSILTTGAGIGGSAVLEVFSSSTNTAAGVFTSLVCGQANGTTTLVATYDSYVVGNTYFVRVYSTNNISLSTAAGFSVCITNPPSNDNCSGATALTPAGTCGAGSRADGTLIGASNSGIAGTCGGSADDDVWFSFVAQFVTQNITVDNISTTGSIAVNGSGIGGTAMVEIFSSTGGCAGTFTSINCGYASGNNLIAFANGLTVGNTYYIRVYSANNVRLFANANFRVCVQNPNLSAPTNTYFGKSFINITKGAGGGTVEPGDVLEIRAAITLRGTGTLDSCGFFDNVPAGTTFVPGSLAVLTNEGKVYKSFTDAAGDDAGTISGGAITVNLGFAPFDGPATPYRRGRLKNTHAPTLGGGAMLMMVSYRVTVTAPLNSIINLGGGQFTYSLLSNITNVLTNNFNQNNVIVYSNTGLCANSTGVNVLDAGLAGDFNGTFGSGNTINRVASPNMPPGHTYVTQTGSAPGDFTYTISNNMSNNAAGYSTTDAWPKPESPQTHRIFGVWDVIGDHTGAADPLAGNPAADTTNGGIGGYMLLVNSAYTLDTVFKYPITGLCPNTYYEISFWVRNVCSRCGVDSLGRGASGVTVPAGYIPTDVGDSSGVRPNLSFSIDGVNHYTTGNMMYTGQWVQKGFVFRTGSQTDIVFAIANNAPGGGGNDWALDDIRLSTCTPNLNLVPSGNSQVCYSNQVDVNCDVISYFDNYTYYQWQISRDNGVTWNDTLSMGNGTPTLDAGNYVYNAAFPTFLADSSRHLSQYRIRVATSPTNLYGGCSFYNSLNIIVMVNNCSEVLNTNLLSFDAELKNRHAFLTWKTADETGQTKYEIQRSSDGVTFVKIGTVYALNQLTSTYTYTDPDELRSFAYYRVVVVDPQGRKNSRIRLLNVTDIPYEIMSVRNPFNNKLNFDLSMPENSKATIILSDQHSRSVKVVRQIVVKGLNHIEIPDLGSLPAGTYILQVVTDNGSKAKRVIKIGS